MKKSNLRQIIRSILREIEEESNIHEMNTTGNIEGYQTPYAFSDKDEEDHKDDIKSKAEVFDYKTTENEKTNTVKLNEGKSLFHVFRDHPDLSPEQKVGVTIREINKLINEMQKLVNVSARYKAETKLTNNKMWKTTNRYILKLDEKLKRISSKIRELK